MTGVIKTKNARFSIFVGLLVSTISLWIAITEIELEKFTGAFLNINYFYIILMMAMLAMGLRFRANRWMLVAGNEIGIKPFSHATNIGVLSNMLLPLRAGEFIKIVTLKKITNVRLAVPVVSAFIDRLLDVFVLMLSSLALYYYMPVNENIAKWLATFIQSGLGIFVLLVFLSASFNKWHKIINFLTRKIVNKWHLKMDAFICELKHEFKSIFSGRLSIKLFAFIALVFTSDYFAVYFSLKAFSLSLPIESALLLWVFLAIGSSLPSAPGYVGVYQVAAIWALSFFHVDASLSAAISVALQLVTFLVVILMLGPGFVKLLKSAIHTNV